MGGGGSSLKQLPQPNGPFGVGCVDLMIDGKLPESAAFELKNPDPNTVPLSSIEKIVGRAFESSIYGRYPDGLFLRLFYPAEHKFDQNLLNDELFKQRRVDWLPSIEYVKGLAAVNDISPWKVQLFYKYGIGDILVPAWFNTRPAPVPQWLPDGDRGYPLIVISHGLTSGRYRTQTLATHLASYGFVVANLEHWDGSGAWSFRIDSNGRKVDVPYEKWDKTKETVFAIANRQNKKRTLEAVQTKWLLGQISEGNFPNCLNGRFAQIRLGTDFDWQQFRGKIDCERSAIIGHSFGAATAIQASMIGETFRCAIVLDGWMHPIHRDDSLLPQKPLLFIVSPIWQEAKNLTRIEQMSRNNSNNVLIGIRGSQHSSYTDWPYLISNTRLLRMLGLAQIEQSQAENLIDPLLAGKITDDLILAFLQYHLKLSKHDPLPSIVRLHEKHLMSSKQLLGEKDRDDNGIANELKSVVTSKL